MDASFCIHQNIIPTAKVMRNNTSSEMIDMTRDVKNYDPMKPSAASLVQRYTRNGIYTYFLVNTRSNDVITKAKLLTKNFPIEIYFADIDLPKTFGRSSSTFQRPKSNRIRMSPLRQNRDEQHNQTETVFSTDEWIVKSGCHFSCINQSMGIQIISSKIDQSTNIQLCNAELFVSWKKKSII